MVLTNVAILASDTARTKAYLQSMIKNDLMPSLCILFSDEDLELNNSLEPINYDMGKYFNREMPLMALIKKYNLPYVFVNNGDINSDEMRQVIAGIEQDYIIYSGYGGGILKPHLFNIGKKYLHMHAGILPEYRGSTTAYYSILDKGTIGVTAFFLNENLDDGDIICQHEYKLPDDGVDIDYIYEPYLRAQELVCALKLYVENGLFDTYKQKRENAETYYIIHPVLKHLAIKRVVTR